MTAASAQADDAPPPWAPRQAHRHRRIAVSFHAGPQATWPAVTALTGNRGAVAATNFRACTGSLCQPLLCRRYPGRQTAAADSSSPHQITHQLLRGCWAGRGPQRTTCSQPQNLRRDGSPKLPRPQMYILPSAVSTMVCVPPHTACTTLQQNNAPHQTSHEYVQPCSAVRKVVYIF